MKKNRENSEKGQALLLVLVLLLVGVLIITSSLNFLGTTRKTNEVYIANTTSLYAADAGINDAEWQLENATSDVPTSSANDVTYPLTMINGYTPSVTIHMQDSQTYQVTSVAGKTTITSLIVAQLGSGTGLFNDAIVTTGGSGITFVNKGNATITGNTFVSGQISFNGGSNTFNGNVYASGGITGSGGIITGSQEITTGNDSVGTPTIVPLQSFTTPDSQMTTLRQNIISSNTVAGGPPWLNTANPWSPASGSYNGQTVEYGITLSGSTITFNSGTPLYVGGDLTLASGTNNVIFNCPVEIAGSITSNKGGGILTFNNSLYVGGSITIGSAYEIIASQAMYIKGNISLTNGAYIAEADTTPSSTNKCIIVDGNITMNGGTSLGDVNQMPLIVDLTAGSTITLGAGGEIDAAIYAPSASASLTGAANIYGSLIVGSVTTDKGSPTITNDPSLSSRSDLSGFTGGVAGTPSGFKILTYNIQ